MAELFRLVKYSNLPRLMFDNVCTCGMLTRSEVGLPDAGATGTGSRDGDPGSEFGDGMGTYGGGNIRRFSWGYSWYIYIYILYPIYPIDPIYPTDHNTSKTSKISMNIP